LQQHAGLLWFKSSQLSRLRHEVLANLDQAKKLGTKTVISNKTCSELGALCFDEEPGKKCACQ